MEIKTLEGIDIERITNVFNESFSDYFIPFKLTEEQLRLKMLADKTNLNLSVGAFDHEKLIAFILHGFDIVNNQKVVYNGGTGALPQYRGQGITKKMYDFALPTLKEKGIDKIVLEVINKNIPAIKSYEKVGFKTTRELLCYKGEIEALNQNKQLDIKELQNYNWNEMESFWDISPTWQNSKNVLDELKNDNISLGAYSGNQLLAYVIYNPTSKRLQQIAVKKDYRKKRIASTLILALKEKYGKTLSVINVDKNSIIVNSFFNKIGLKNNLAQLEMELVLNNN